VAVLLEPGLPDLSGTVTLVTGAGGGIGAGIAARFAAAGAAVVLHHREGDSAASARAGAQRIVDAGGRAITVAADITEPDACTELVATALHRLGRLDAVVACAGVQPVAELVDLSSADWRSVLDTNATGTFATLQAAAAVMGERGGGSITLVGSIEGTRPAVRSGTPTTPRPKRRCSCSPGPPRSSTG
jgi:NAD(P)-dependent dehydrogenase (short-subunit alcohol dehydrogenase family)